MLISLLMSPFNKCIQCHVHVYVSRVCNDTFSHAKIHFMKNMAKM